MPTSSSSLKSRMTQCDCGEWVLTERLSNHRIWAHNVGGAVGIKYWAPDEQKRYRRWYLQLKGVQS